MFSIYLCTVVLRAPIFNARLPRGLKVLALSNPGLTFPKEASLVKSGSESESELRLYGLLVQTKQQNVLIGYPNGDSAGS